MTDEILYSEEISVSKSAKQWIIAIVLLIDFTGYSLLYHYYQTGTIPNQNFSKDAMISVSAVGIIFTIIILLMIFLLGYSLIIDNKGIHLKGKAGEKKNIDAANIKQVKKISKKEARKLMSGTNNRKKKKGKIKQFLIGTPNYLIVLKNGDKILLQVKKNASFEFSIQKIMGNNG